MSWLLALDTATSSVVVAVGDPDGTLVAERSFPAEHRHGERLLREIEQLMADEARSVDGLAGIVVGTGPGAFTGLRVGLATAKTLAHALGLPIAGVSTGEALIAAALSAAGGARAGVRSAAASDAAGDGSSTLRGALVLALPAGPHDRVVVRRGSPASLVPGGVEIDLGPDERLVAVDLPDRAPDDAVALGAVAVRGLAANLLGLGVGRLAAGGDDPELLVPEYVTLPRGVREAGAAAEPGGGIAWSRGPR